MKTFLKKILRRYLEKFFWLEICKISELNSRLEIIEDELALLRVKGRGRESILDKFLTYRSKKDDFLYDEVFILGSGPSILNLCQEEKEYIRTKKTIAMNRYPLYWNIVDIWPDYIFMADSAGIGKRVFKEIEVKLLESDKGYPTFILEKYFREFLHPEFRAVFFNRNLFQPKTLNWARALDEDIFYHRGSLTCLLNVLSILRLAPKIKLIGIDLNQGGAFFDKEIHRYPDLINPWDKEATANNVHATVGGVKGWQGSMLDVWPLLSNFLSESGITLYSCNPNSLLVEEKLVDYSPVMINTLIS